MPRCRDAGRDGSYIDTATVSKTVDDLLDRKEHARADGNLDVTALEPSFEHFSKESVA
jgi:hypothetical protein